MSSMSIVSEIVLAPPTATARIVVAGVVLLALALAVYVRADVLSTSMRRGLGALRMLIVSGLIVVLLGPSAMRWLSRRDDRRKLVVVVDTSCSFGVEDVDGESRFAAARDTWLTPERIQALRERFDLRFYRFDETLATTNLGALWEMTAPTGRQSYMAGAIQRLLETEFAHGGEPAGILLIGDGHETGPGDVLAAGELAGQRGVPIWTSCFGGQREDRDVAIQTFSGQEFLFANQTGQIAAKVLQTGFGIAEARVVLLREGQPVQQQRVTFNDRAAADVRFDIQEAEPGLVAYEVRVDPLPGEVETTNNARAVFVRVSNERIKVLLVEGQPYWDTKFLAQSLRTDEQIELTHLVHYGTSRFHAIRSGGQAMSAADEVEEAAVAVPSTKAELFAYDVLIFGKGLPTFMDPARMDLLKAFLDERGGGIVFARGRAYDRSTFEGAHAAAALAAIEPAVWGDRYVRDLELALTPEGRSHPSFQFPVARAPDVIIQEMPGMIGAVRVRQAKAAALVLAESRPRGAGESDLPMAAVAYQNYGKGKVVAILNEGLWQWALRPAKPDRDKADAPFDVFWRRMMRWLVGVGDFLPGQDVTLAVTQPPGNLGESAQIEVRMKFPPRPDTPVTLSAVMPDSTEQPLPLAQPAADSVLRWASFVPEQEGIYRIRLRTPECTPPEQETRFCVYDYTAERIQTSADPTTMRELAARSGGQAIDPAEPGRLLTRLAEAHPSEQTHREIEFVWDQPWVFAVLVTLLAVEWFLRRRCGVA
ncbi:MAG: hypothetical protein JXA69_21240 [Phycisphaerae bacterium]|nr:hypothetical protein [Phycisphaerae bacterium]